MSRPVGQLGRHVTFTYWGSTFDYFDHPYNTTVLNERAVEIPIVRDWLPDGEGLEVGNVLSHYQPVTHRVVDRHERGVENLDVFDITGEYDWVLSISTLEHVRWDPPEPQDPNGSIRALQHLRGLLRPGGRMLVTVPLGHQPHLDAVLMANETGATRACTLVRHGDGWRQTHSLRWEPYGKSTKWAESVWIGEWQ